MFKFILVLTALTFLSSCATYIRTTYEQDCAMKGMKLAGVSEDNGVGVHSNGTSSRYNSETLNCRVPVGPDEKAEVTALKEEASPIVEYNEGVHDARFYNFLGYFLYVVPGVGLKFYYDHKKDNAIEKSHEIVRARQRTVSSDAKP